MKHILGKLIARYRKPKKQAPPTPIAVEELEELVYSQEPIPECAYEVYQFIFTSTHTKSLSTTRLSFAKMFPRIIWGTMPMTHRFYAIINTSACI